MPVTTSTLVASGLSAAIVASFGGAVAANDALPGDFLYPVKTHFTETIESNFTFGTDAMAHYETNRAMRRFEEAQRLHASGRLTAGLRAALEKDFEGHWMRASALADELEAKGNATAAAAIRTNMERFMAKHNGSLNAMADADGGIGMPDAGNANASGNVDANTSADGDANFRGLGRILHDGGIRFDFDGSADTDVDVEDEDMDDDEADANGGGSVSTSAAATSSVSSVSSPANGGDSSEDDEGRMDRVEDRVDGTLERLGL